MTFTFRLKTSPNHQYSDLEAGKLVYKLLKLVLGDRVSFKKKGGGYRFVRRFSTLKQVDFFFMTFNIDLNTGPNHQYSDLEAEKLVYKLVELVLDDRVSFQKRVGGYSFFRRFST